MCSSQIEIASYWSLLSIEPKDENKRYVQSAFDVPLTEENEKEIPILIANNIENNGLELKQRNNKSIRRKITFYINKIIQ